MKFQKTKGKGKLSHHTPRRRLGERRYSSYSLSVSTLDGVSGQRHATDALCPGVKTPGTHCTGGWVGHRAGLAQRLQEKSFQKTIEVNIWD
jgi:hypothetical protein